MTFDTPDAAVRPISAPYFRKPIVVMGPRLSFRPAALSDAEFILSLRLDSSKNRFLSKTPDDLDAQRRWLADIGDDQVYFIIETDRPLGTVRLYDKREFSFCWGSWILNEGAPKSSAVESTLMVYHFAVELGFSSSHFDVRKNNEKVWQYHERLGAVRVGENDDDYFYQIDQNAIKEMFRKYDDRLKSPISIVW